MSKVTNIKSITNNTSYPITVIDGENGTRFSVAGSGVWNGDLWIPWVGNDGEDYKPIEIIGGSNSDYTIFIYQDYWYPPHESPVKYRNTSPFIYDDGNNMMIPGNNTGGGERTLILTAHGKDILPKLV